MRTKSSKKNKINFITLGCSKNIYDSEVIMGQVQASKKDVVHEREGNIVVINTCGFIESAKEESIDTILKNVEKKRTGKVDKLYVTGCLSERYREELRKEIPEVDQYFGVSELPRLLKALRTDYRQELTGERLLTTPQSYAYLKIAEGCNRTCSFCAIPKIRGKHISKPIEKIVEEAKSLAKKGVKELILIAQELTFYGMDLYGKRCLPELLEEIVRIDGIAWIRLHYTYPNQFPMEVLEVMKKEKKICNYLDIPLQHISGRILKSMRRGITSIKTNQLIEQIRKTIPGIALRTTLIVGYPGETEEEFEQLKKWVKETEFERLGCFPYAHEEGTPAFKLKDDVSKETKKQRVSEIMNIQAQISKKLNQKKIGKTLKVIIDRREGKYYIGRTEFDSPDVDNEVLIDTEGKELKVGTFVLATIYDSTDFDLYAKLISSWVHSKMNVCFAIDRGSLFCFQKGNTI